MCEAPSHPAGFPSAPSTGVNHLRDSAPPSFPENEWQGCVLPHALNSPPRAPDCRHGRRLDPQGRNAHPQAVSPCQFPDHKEFRTSTRTFHCLTIAVRVAINTTINNVGHVPRSAAATSFFDTLRSCRCLHSLVLRRRGHHGLIHALGTRPLRLAPAAQHPNSRRTAQVIKPSLVQPPFRSQPSGRLSATSLG